MANKRVAAAEQTRANLIETGLVLSEKLGLEGLSVNAVVAGAGVSKGTFFHHFPDRVSYLVALHRRFHDVLFDEVMAVIGEMTPGKDRLAEAPQRIWTGAYATTVSRRCCWRRVVICRSPRKSRAVTG